MASGIHHIIGDVEPVSFDDKINEKPVTGILTDSTTPTSPTTLNLNGVSGFKLSEACIDDVRPMKIAVIGAGFSGITAGIRYDMPID